MMVKKKLLHNNMNLLPTKTEANYENALITYALSLF